MTHTLDGLRLNRIAALKSLAVGWIVDAYTNRLAPLRQSRPVEVSQRVQLFEALAKRCLFAFFECDERMKASRAELCHRVIEPPTF